jgi:hypothetical protein
MLGGVTPALKLTQPNAKIKKSMGIDNAAGTDEHEYR